MEQRLQKILSGAGICSRRAAEQMLTGGRVTVNGRTAQLGDKADPERDAIAVDGKPVGGRVRAVTIMLNKPAGVVTTMHDEKGRRCVADLVRGGPVRVLPVGRLDQYSEGMLLMTNDGALLAALTHPRNHVDKTYAVTVRGDASRIQDLSKPMVIDGYRIRPAQVKTKKMGTDGVHELHITIHEGRNRQIRKMCAQCGFKVLRLCRIAMGPLRLENSLRPGHWRELTAAEMQALRRASGLEKTDK